MSGASNKQDGAAVLIAIRCEIDTPQGTVRLIATHLGLSLRERRDQVRVLLRASSPTRRSRRWSSVTSMIGSGSDQFERR